MDDRRKKIATIAIAGGFLLLVIIFVGSMISGKKILSPVPDDGAIRIIFLTPTPEAQKFSATPPATPTQ
ncbi:hypothetical protein KKB64_02160 [Patescibacteria group bacterium]|nr:hypothetical protein [Patescibacteria group bacterium]MBU1472572.1 hypothetical protein [Patescibacteria group bacterium]MBU2459823.1 hypothetical protein [Patescibacteria group bacterium]MBU2544115.1 hypothetical protein [Patescibacteria group bacterium]